MVRNLKEMILLMVILLKKSKKQLHLIVELFLIFYQNLAFCGFLWYNIYGVNLEKDGIQL